MSARRLSGIGLLLAGLLLCAIPARATQPLRLSFPELVRRADRIVHARCVGVRAGPADGGPANVEVTFAVIEGLKRVSADRLVIRQLRTAPGLGPTTGFAVGDEVLLFLRADGPSGLTSPVGFAQGVFRVTRTRGVPAVRGDGVPAVVRHIMRHTHAAAVATTPQSSLPLADLIGAVRALEAGR